MLPSVQNALYNAATGLPRQVECEHCKRHSQQPTGGENRENTRMNSASCSVLILPGLGNSGPQHWQTEWERHDASMMRVMQDEWHAPRCEDWAARLDEVFAPQSNSVVFVTHSASCALVAHWARVKSTTRLARVRGALLVAPSDPTGQNIRWAKRVSRQSRCSRCHSHRLLWQVMTIFTSARQRPDRTRPRGARD